MSVHLILEATTAYLVEFSVNFYEFGEFNELIQPNKF